MQSSEPMGGETEGGDEEKQHGVQQERENETEREKERVCPSMFFSLTPPTPNVGLF